MRVQGRKEGRKEERKGGREEGRKGPDLNNTSLLDVKATYGGLNVGVRNVACSRRWMRVG